MTSSGIDAGLREGTLDVGLTYLDNEPLRDVRTHALYTEQYLYLVPEGGPHADAPSLAWSQLAGGRLCLLSPDMQHRRILDRIFCDAGVAPRPALETNSITTLYAHVRDGVAPGVVTHTWLQLFALPAGLRAIPLVQPRAAAHDRRGLAGPGPRAPHRPGVRRARPVRGPRGAFACERPGVRLHRVAVSPPTVASQRGGGLDRRHPNPRRPATSAHRDHTRGLI